MIELDKVDFYYNESSYILRDINIRVSQGDFVGINGHNGSGKSTLVNLILKILEPKSGKVVNKFVDENMKVSYLSQIRTSSEINFPANVEEIIELGFYKSKRKRSEYKDEIQKLLYMFNLENKRRNLLSELSGGQRQKVILAKSIIDKPSLVVLDEPDSGVDSDSLYTIYNALKSLNKENNTTILIISHNLDFLMKYCDKLYKLSKGCLTKELI